MDKIMQINAFIVVLYLLFRVVFRYRITFLWNRIYLLLLIPVSIFIPFIPELFPQSGEIYFSQLPIFTVSGGESVSILVRMVSVDSQVNTLSLVWFFYGLFALLFLSYYTWQHLSLIYRLQKEEIF